MLEYWGLSRPRTRDVSFPHKLLHNLGIEITLSQVDPAQALRAMIRFFPDATTFYVQGTSIDPEVETLYRLHFEDGPHLLENQTRWPRSRKFRCRFSKEFVDAFCDLAERHAVPELLDHLGLYRDTSELVFRHDAFGEDILVSGSIPEPVVSAFATELGLEAQRIGSG